MNNKNPMEIVLKIIKKDENILRGLNMKKTLKNSTLIISIPHKFRKQALEVVDEAMELPNDLYEIFVEDMMEAAKNRLRVLKD